MMKIVENKQLYMDCPVCGTRHYVHIVKREATANIDGEEVVYPQEVYICKMENRAEDEFYPAGVEEENLKRAKAVLKAKKAPPPPASESTEEPAEDEQQ